MDDSKKTEPENQHDDSRGRPYQYMRPAELLMRAIRDVATNDSPLWSRLGEAFQLHLLLHPPQVPDPLLQARIDALIQRVSGPGTCSETIHRLPQADQQSIADELWELAIATEHRSLEGR